VARGNQDRALGFFLNPAPKTGILSGRRFRFEKSTFSLEDPRVDGSKRGGPGLPVAGDWTAAGESARVNRSGMTRAKLRGA